MGREKNLKGRNGSHNGKTCLLEEHPPQDPLLQLRSLHNRFPPYKTQASFANQTLLKLGG